LHPASCPLFQPTKETCINQTRPTQETNKLTRDQKKRHSTCTSFFSRAILSLFASSVFSCSVSDCAVLVRSVMYALRSSLCVAVCCSVLQCVAVCCSVLQCQLRFVAVCCSCTVLVKSVMYALRSSLCVAVCCSVLQCVPVCCSVSCGLLQCVAAAPSW